jgi:uncharacterized membrane protein YqhA
VRRGGQTGGLFERLLWGSRLLVLVPVVAGLVLAVGVAFVATVDAVYSLGTVARFADPSLGPEARDASRDAVITAVVKVLDGYLISAILIVFSLGLYELFVSKLDAAEDSETGSTVLHVKSLDDLKNKVVSLVLLVLAIEFFQRALRLTYERPVDLLYLAGGVLLISAAFYLIGARSPDNDRPGPREARRASPSPLE